MNTNKELGMRIRYLREQKKMTLEDLAFEANVNKKLSFRPRKRK